MGEIPAAKVQRVLNGLLYSPEAKAGLKATKRAGHWVTIEANGREVVAWQHDTIKMRLSAPSGAAARAIVKALRDLQAHRGTIF